MKKLMMEKIRQYLQLSEEVDDAEELRVEGLVKGRSIYEDLSFRGIRVDPGFVSCSFKVPLRLTKLEITSRVLGVKGGYKGTIVVVRNNITGEIIAEDRHSLFGRHASKL